MILILLVAAVVSAVVARELETPIAILVVVLLNAIIGFVQESKAESALEALRRMSTTTTTVRRDGRIVRLDADELVPGDVVVLEAGTGSRPTAGCCPPPPGGAGVVADRRGAAGGEVAVRGGRPGRPARATG